MQDDKPSASEQPSAGSSERRRPKNRARSGERGASRRSRLEPQRPLTDRERQLLATPLSEATYAVFDIETTGGNPERNGITEICALLVQGDEIKDRFYSLVNPGRRIPPIVRKMTGITDAMVRDAPRIDVVMPQFVAFVGDAVLVSHNTIGDMIFLRHFSARTCGEAMPNFFLCTHLLVEKLVAKSPDKSLKGLAEHLDLPAGELHRAEADAVLTLELFRVLRERLLDAGAATIADGVRLQGDTESGVRVGWAVPEPQLRNIPNGPGLYRLFDQADRLHFVSSAAQLARDVTRLGKYALLPRSILKLVLRTYRLEVERTESLFGAMLAEADAAAAQPSLIPAHSLHHRAPQVLTFTFEHGQEVRIDVGVLRPQTFLAYGPIANRKIVIEWLEGVAERLGAKFSRSKGLLLVREQAASLAAILDQRAYGHLSRLEINRWLSLLTLNLREFRYLAEQRRECQAMAEEAFPEPDALQSLLTTSGALIVPKDRATSQFYGVENLQPAAPVTIPSGWQAEGLPAAARDIGRKIADRQTNQEPKPLTREQAERANVVLWWIFHRGKRSDVAFLSMDELRRHLGACASNAR